ncbi:FAD-dependent oxidoreductase [Pseudorhodoplanes sp.]|uniref:FAD-dependent oxidoreductase n=1 Tax=Pseudorhodoplanes sp. TaxID=1934341 RepID=UPI002CA86B54|nr:FAD-dependent oxidoreductase [Pseudorhodoplanes sp.]HWV43738.1 FAD-dependent oxidoreductase [Pseudorhodoplanes sp.]
MTPHASPLRVAIVGSGPSGYYAVEALLQSGRDVEVDVYDRIPVPFGLVRYGVAPDHQKLKEVTRVFTRFALDPRVGFFGNVTVGRDVSVAELGRLYDAVVIASGAGVDRAMNVPGEDLAGSHAAVDFVGWYNGHPDYRDRCFDLSGEHAVIVGQGNVAIDVCRILAKTADELRKTDIAEHALTTLARSRLKTITIVGRRGPAQMKFTTKELRELGTLPGWDVTLDPADLALDGTSAAEMAAPQSATAAKNIEVLRGFAAKPRSNPREIRFCFFAAPHRLEGEGRVESFVVERTRLSGPAFQQRAEGTGTYRAIAADVVFRSIGYAGLPMPGLPFDGRAKIVPNVAGRVRDADGAVVPRLYVTGWIKRGPTGIIGTNRVDSIETVASLLADDLPRQEGAGGRERASALLRERGVRATSFAHWQAIDRVELERGQAKGKVRDKVIDRDEFLSIASGASGEAETPVAAGVGTT